MVRFYIVKFLVGNQIFNRLLVFRRHASFHQLLQQGKHLLLPHGAALQQNLADSQNLAVVQILVKPVLQIVTFFLSVAANLLPQPLLRQKALQRLDISKNRPFRDLKPLRQFFLAQDRAVRQLGVYL